MGGRRICVLGGGNGAHAAAADLEERGHDVVWWRRDHAAFEAIRRQGGLKVVDHRGERLARPRLEPDIAAAVDGAELIVAPVPAFAQLDLADRLAPCLQDGQVVFLPPGTFGSWLMLRRLRATGCTADVGFAETGTLPWLCRKPSEGAIRITTRASRLPTGALPASRSAEALSLIAEAFPHAIEPVEDVLSAALMNAGPIIHPPLILMNAGPIEHFERWDIHAEGTQPSIRRVHDALDAERIALREALGYAPPHFPLRDHYETSNWMYGNLAHDRLVASKDWHEPLDLADHRYMREDVFEGLGLLVGLAGRTGVPAPVASGLLAIGAAASGRRLLPQEGRNTASLGLDALDPAALAARLRDGF